MKMIRLVVKILFLTLTTTILYFVFLLSPTSLSNGKTRFVVSQETNQEEVMKNLKRDGFIRSEKFFSFLTGIIRFPGKIEPGAYILSHKMTTIKIAYTLLYRPYQKWIVLVPGLRVEQIAERLAKKFDWNNERINDFLANSKEGYMAPDTYLLNVDWNGKQVADRLISNFNEKFDRRLQADLYKQNVRNDTAVKIASLIERESGGEADKALIAGIIWNRLDKNMKLEIDATIQYALGAPADWWPRVSGKDMKVDSLYNTYKYKGLPPTPIANPSIASIKAVVYPSPTECLYYLHDLAKRIHCAKTYKEHLENIEKWLR